MPDLKVKIGLIGKLDMLKFKNMKKVREQAIQAAPAAEVKGDFAINRNAKALHPDFLTLVVEEIIDRGSADAKTYVLKSKDGKALPYFRAGMYLNLKLPLDGSLVTRSYSLCSSPKKALEGKYAITIRSNPGGFAADKLLAELKVGDEIISSCPQGFFYYEDLRDCPTVIGLAGGSGITAFRSIAKDMLTSHRPEKFTILYGSRNENDIIFFDELNEIAKQSGGAVEVFNILSEPGEKWTGEKGFISADMIKKLVPDWDKVTYYISGPQPMYDFLDGEFKKMVIKEKFIRKEEYGETTDITKSPLYPKGHENDTFKITVKFGLDEQVISAKATDTVVVSLEKAGLAPDTHCRSGQCGWCRSLLLKGEVWQRPQSDGVRSSDKDYGYFHPCSAYPMSDLVIEVQSRL